jgi:hypothetical protein
MNWLPTMATHWEKKLYLPKEFRSGHQRKIRLEKTTKNRTTSSSTIFFSEVLKDANQ